MMKEVLIHITRIDIFPIISLILFMVFFTAVLVRSLRLNGRHSKYMGNLPLESAEDSMGDEQ